MKPKLPPLGLLSLIALTLATAGFVALSWLGYIPLESLYFYILNTIFSLVAVALLAALGGVFLGMFLAHRALAAREFSPVERAMMEAAQQIRALHAKLDEMDTRISTRLERVEQRGEEAKVRR